MADEHAVSALVAAIRSGDLAALDTLVSADPGVARARLDASGRTALHVATDWPGFLPAAPAVVAALVRAGADVQARTDSGETPLHWAASTDDVDVARALLDAGADPDAPDGSIGTPLDNAVGYGCWHVAALLAERGARIDSLWTAAALGRQDRLDELLAGDPGADTLSQAFWHACAAGQRRAAERLLAAGADPGWVPDYADGTLADAVVAPGTAHENLLGWLRDLRA